jgi:hypothetical protein
MPEERPTYMESVFTVANMYNTDPSFTYNMVESACRDIARDYNRQSYGVMCDFEIAQDELKNPS